MSTVGACPPPGSTVDLTALGGSLARGTTDPAAVGAAEDAKSRIAMPVASTAPASQAAPTLRGAPTTSTGIAGSHTTESITGEPLAGSTTGTSSRSFHEMPA